MVCPVDTASYLHGPEYPLPLEERAQTPDLNAKIEEELNETVAWLRWCRRSLDRSLLNLTGSAFDAVYERAASEDGEYATKVIVRTRRSHEEVEVAQRVLGHYFPNVLDGNE